MKYYSRFCVLCLMIFTICCSYMPNAQYVSANENTFDVDARSAFLMDAKSGEVIFEKAANEHLPIASMVKLMTILLTFEEIESGRLTYETPITTSENASGMGGSQVFIDPFVQYKTKDLLKSVIMASANDASVALAEHISGSEGLFVNAMNKRAKELQMNGTLYKNATGLPAPEQYSSARDSALLLKELLNHKDYHKFSTIWMDELVHPSGRKTELVNTNKLIRYFKGCDGGKTGSTNEAGYCLSASAEKDNMRLISVVIGAKTGKDRFNESSKLLNYGFNNFENKLIIDKSVSIGTIQIKKGKDSIVDVYANEDFYALIKKGKDADVEAFVDIIKSVKAPLDKGEVVGKITISKKGQVLKEIDVVITSDIESIGFMDGFKKVVENW